MKKITRQFFQSVIDSLPEQIAIIDQQGEIMATNKAWDRIALTNGNSGLNKGKTKDNYLDICEKASQEDERIKYVLRNLQLILSGEKKHFSFEYPHHDNSDKRWYLIHATILKNGENKVGAVITHINITKRKNAELKAKRLASKDDMTGIFNRKTGIQELYKEIKLSERRQSMLSLCYIDIDNLKFINDNFGHKEGDEIIKKTVSIINNTLRETDEMARMGGDEFLVIFPDTSVNNAKVVMKRVLEKIDGFNRKRSKPYELSISFGFAQYDHSYRLNADKLIEAADTEMYRMKRSHKKNYPYFILEQNYNEADNTN